MFASRRLFPAASRQLSGLSSRTIPFSARLYATEATAATTPAAETPAAAAAAAAPAAAPAAPEEKPVTPPAPAKPAATTTTYAPKPTRVVKPTKPAVSAAAPALSYSDVVYNAKNIAFEDRPAEEDSSTGVPFINWANSYHGISVKPVSEKQFKALIQPVEEKDIEVKPDGVVYLPEIKYRRRLNEVFGPMGWGIIPKGEAVVGDHIVTREYALIVDGRFVSQAQGENSYFGADQLPSAVEGCKSNALMRCCKDLGIASELWDPHFIRWFRKNHMEEVWVEHLTTKKKRLQWYRKGSVEVTYPYKLSK